MKKLYWTFHAVLFVAFIVGFLGFVVEGPRQFWSYTFQTSQGPVGLSRGTTGTNIYYGWHELDVDFTLYSLVAFACAAALFCVAASLGFRLILHRA